MQRLIARASSFLLFTVLAGTVIISELSDALVFLNLLPAWVSTLCYMLFIMSDVGWILATGSLLIARRQGTVYSSRHKFFLAVGVTLILISGINRFPLYDDEPSIRMFINTSFVACGLILLGWIAGTLAIALKSVELDREADFSECLGDLLLIVFWPVGVWFIQPRINRIMIN